MALIGYLHNFGNMAKETKKAPVKGAKNIKVKTSLTADQLLTAAINTPIKKKGK